MSKIGARPFLQRFLISYLTILFIPVLLNILIYRSSTQVVREYVENANLAMISQAGFALDQRINNLRTLVLRNSIDTRLDALCKKTRPLPPAFHLDLSLAVKELRSTFLVDDMVTDYFIYMTNSDYVIDGDSVTSADIFFKYAFQYGEWDKHDWLEFLKSTYHRCSVLPAAIVQTNTQDYTAVPLVWSTPFYFDTSNNTFVVFLVSEDAIFDYFKPLAADWKGFLSIYDAKGDLVISSASHDEEVQAENLITVGVSSVAYDLRYELSVPVSRLYEHLFFIRKLMFLITFLAMVVGSLTAFWFSAVNSKPLHSMASLLSMQPETAQGANRQDGSNPFDSLNTSVRQIITTNESLRKRLADQKLVINEVFFYRLLKEGFETRAEMKVMQNYLDVPETSGTHGVALLNFLLEQEIVNEQTMEEMKGLKLLLLDLIKLESLYQSSWVDIGENSITFLLTNPDSNRRQWESKMEAELKRISLKIERAVPFDIFWTVGNPVSDFINLHTSYQQARELSRLLAKEQRKGIHWYRDFTNNRADYYLPMDFLQRLYNFCRAGDYEVAHDIFLENWDENMSSRSLSPLVLQQYLLDLRGLLIRLDPSIAERILPADLEHDDLGSIRDLFLGEFERICRHVNLDRKSSHDKFKDEIAQYIAENYHDISLSLHSVASHFNISEGYLSHFFKKISGSNFYTFLECTRLEHASERLKSTKDAIKEIAHDVGYSNVHSFRRAFKRVYGVSPSAYREI